MLPIQNVTYTKCYLYKMLPIQNVTYTKSYQYQMLPRQSVLDEMLLYENVLYETLLIHFRLIIDPDLKFILRQSTCLLEKEDSICSS